MEGAVIILYQLAIVTMINKSPQNVMAYTHNTPLFFLMIMHIAGQFCSSEPDSVDCSWVYSYLGTFGGFAGGWLDKGGLR